MYLSRSGDQQVTKSPRRESISTKAPNLFFLDLAHLKLKRRITRSNALTYPFQTSGFSSPNGSPDGLRSIRKSGVHVSSGQRIVKGREVNESPVSAVFPESTA